MRQAQTAAVASASTHTTAAIHGRRVERGRSLETIGVMIGAWSAHLLGGHVADCAKHDAGRCRRGRCGQHDAAGERGLRLDQLRQTEVENLRVAVRRA
jgi:hypothetical protein